jgi:hypothetical protein
VPRRWHLDKALLYTSRATIVHKIAGEPHRIEPTIDALRYDRVQLETRVRHELTQPIRQTSP